MKIPMTKDGTIADGGVPFVVTYRKILKRPKIKRERKYVGTVQMVKNMLARAIEAIEQAAFETTTEYLDPGESVAVHWAVTVADPFDTRAGQEKPLVCFRMENDIPPNGLHFEVYVPDSKPPSDIDPKRAEAPKGPQTNYVHDLSPEQFETLRRRQQGEATEEQQELLRGTRGINGGFRRPHSPEYGQRPIKTIDEEVGKPPRIIQPGVNEESADEESADEEASHEELESLGRPSGQREDD